MTPETEWWVSLIEALVVINLVMVTFAYLTLAERKAMGRKIGRASCRERV